MEDQLDSLKDIIYDYLENNDLYYEDIEQFKKFVIENMELIHPNFDHQLIINNFFKCEKWEIAMK